MRVKKEEFLRYERVRRLGVVNMFDIERVEMLTDLPREKILDIMQNYSKYKKMYLDERTKKKLREELEGLF